MIILTSFQLLQPPSLLLPLHPPLSRDSFTVLIFDFLPETSLKLEQIPTLALFRFWVLVHSRPGRSFPHEEGVEKKGSNSKDGIGASWATGQVVASSHFPTFQHHTLLRWNFYHLVCCFNLIKLCSSVSKLNLTYKFLFVQHFSEVHKIRITSLC